MPPLVKPDGSNYQENEQHLNRHNYIQKWAEMNAGPRVVNGENHRPAEIPNFVSGIRSSVAEMGCAVSRDEIDENAAEQCRDYNFRTKQARRAMRHNDRSSPTAAGGYMLHASRPRSPRLFGAALGSVTWDYAAMP